MIFAHTQQEVADALGISTTRVQQLEQSALAKLRLALGVDDVTCTLRAWAAAQESEQIKRRARNARRASAGQRRHERRDQSGRFDRTGE